MACTTVDELRELVDEARPYAAHGKVADYIPALGRANQDDLSVAVYTNEGCHSAGDVETRFTLQSVSKILTLALAICDLGIERVFAKVGMEPTGDPFHSISKLETQKPSKPLNPMINAGALTVTTMINGKDNDEKLARLLTLVRDMTGNEKITYNQTVADSEFETAFLNRALCYFLKQHGVIDGDVEKLIDLYTKQCAIEVNCVDLARIGYVLSNEGFCPITGKAILPEKVARIVKTFMVTCGMYNASGEFAIKVGIPAKSGVSGAILGTVPGKMGIGVYGPALDEKGNSIAGIKFLESFSKRKQLSIFL